MHTAPKVCVMMKRSPHQNHLTKIIYESEKKTSIQCYMVTRRPQCCIAFAAADCRISCIVRKLQAKAVSIKTK